MKKYVVLRTVRVRGVQPRIEAKNPNEAMEFVLRTHPRLAKDPTWFLVEITPDLEEMYDLSAKPSGFKKYRIK